MNATAIPAGAHPVLGCAEARAWEERLLGDDERLARAAMDRAGRALARAVAADLEETGGLPGAARLLVLCGRGHNGGDALLALHALLDARPRASARVLVPGGFRGLRPLVRRALEDLLRAHGPRVACEGGRLALAELAHEGFDLCLDGLFGMRFRPPLRGPDRALVDAVNRHPAIRLRAAVDVPSGLGDASDPAPFRADFTYATGIAKAPLFAPENAGAVGRVRHLDLGFFDEARPPAARHVLTAAVLAPLRALRPALVDKRSFGHLFILGGARTMPGAALMAVEAALHAGVGLVTAFVPESVAGAFAARLPEAMWVPMPETPSGGLALEGRASVVARATRCTALLAGPGLGRERESLALVAEVVRAVEAPVVLDADALQPEVVAARAAGLERALVLTPHAGEFARLGGDEPRDDAALLATAGRLGATVVLKGAPTRVGAGGAVFVSPFGGPVLARGGSGDLLAGMIAARLAAGDGPLEGALRGVVWHGRAADRLARVRGQGAVRVTRLIEHLGDALHPVGEFWTSHE